ncbi:MAG TPA: oligoribonuclease [Candidatus Limnocylindrales bacterium]|nr:oligoribonuclease [Candidatus Limnocylindrales bacterium]
MSDKDVIPTKLLWVDLEMTGLDQQQDLILEIAAEITDFDFATLASYEACVQQNREVVLERMQANIWWRDYPENRDSFVQKLADGKPLRTVEQEMIALVEKNFGSEPAILAGNSIHNDRLFIKRWMPALDLKLHYRMLDVTSWKVLMQTKFGLSYDKKEVHRAYDDIQASIAELQYYLDWFNQHGNK